MQLQISKLDPLLCDFEMPLQAVFHPQGFEVEVATNSSAVLDAATESWGHFRKIFSGPRLRLRVGVEGESVGCPPEPVCREQLNLRTRVADAQNFSVTDLQQGFAFAWLTRTAVERRAYLRSEFLEGIGWDLLVSSCMTPVHAACVKRGGHGLLLCGDSGAGKSTLAYACARRGWTYLSDDYCYLVRGRNDRMLVGNPYHIRLRESTAKIYPELRRFSPTLRYGEMVIEFATAGIAGIRTALTCPIDQIVFLNRGAYSMPQLVPLPKDGVLEWFEKIIWGTGRIRDEHRNTLLSLLTAKLMELRYDDLHSAVELLEAVIPCEIGQLPQRDTAQDQVAERA